MTVLDEIFQSYSTIDAWLGASKPPHAIEQPVSLSRMAELNGYAFFVLLFGQLEQFIDCEYSQSIGPCEEAPFIHRANLVFSENNSAANLIGEYYYLRCQFAHGNTEPDQLGDRITVPDAYDRIRRILSQ